MSDGYGKQNAGFGLTREQSVDLIVRSCLDHGVTDTRQIAYVLATAQHESKDFQAPEEDWGRKQAVTLSYHGGEAYYGRGYAHLTHVELYEKLGEKAGLGRELVQSPSRAAEPAIAAKILVAGMRDGDFVQGQTLAAHINADKQDYAGARAIINPRDAASVQTIAGYARTWEASVPALVERAQREAVAPAQPPAASNAPASVGKGDANQTVFEAQQYLAALGMTDSKGKAISPDGDFGAGTEHAVKQYERSKGVAEPTGRVDAAMLAELRADTLQAQPQFKRQTMTDLYGPLKDGELRRGEKGEPVYELRRQLQGLGYIQNAPPNWGGDRLYDEHIEAGVRAFQKANGLQETGRADTETRRQLNASAVSQHLAPTTEFDRPENWPPQPPPYTRAEYQTRQQAPAQPAPSAPATQEPSPDQRRGQAPTPAAPAVMHSSLYQDCSNGVDALDRQLGRASDTASACMKASLTELATRNGLTRVDHVLLSERGRQAEPGQYVFVVEGDPRNPASLRAHMPTDQAINTPVEVSFGALAQSEQQRQASLQAQVAMEQQRDAQTREANSRSMG